MDMKQTVADAMEAKRRELIAQPLARIWPQLAEAAIQAMREPTFNMVKAGSFFTGYDADPVPGDFDCVASATEVYRAMLEAALSENS